MKQLGNLAIVAANSGKCTLIIRGDTATVTLKHETAEKTMICNVWDDDYIQKIIAFINFGTKIPGELQKNDGGIKYVL